MGVPEIVHEVGDRNSPEGRASAELNEHDVTAVPPSQERVIGEIVKDTQMSVLMLA